MLACIYHKASGELDKSNCIRLLKDCGGYLNTRNNESGFTCMHWVARWGEIENIKYLHESGMAIYIPDNDGYIPLDYAGHFKHTESMLYLITKGVEEVKWQLMMSFSKTTSHKHSDADGIFCPEL